MPPSSFLQVLEPGMPCVAARVQFQATAQTRRTCAACCQRRTACEAQLRVKRHRGDSAAVRGSAAVPRGACGVAAEERHPVGVEGSSRDEGEAWDCSQAASLPWQAAQLPPDAGMHGHMLHTPAVHAAQLGVKVSTSQFCFLEADHICTRGR